LTKSFPSKSKKQGDTAKVKNILCYGDSNTYGTRPDGKGRWDMDTRWPCVLQKMLGSGYHVIEEGCGYRTTVFEDPIEPYKNGRTYLYPCLYSHRPLDLVILMLGTNDMKTRFSASATDIAQGAKALADIVKNFDYRGDLSVPEVLVVCPPQLGERISDDPLTGAFSPVSYQKSLRLWMEFKKTIPSEYHLINAADYAKPSEIDQVHMDAKDHYSLAQGICTKVHEMIG
jgi:lysophospholipase L1-like esterase